MGPNVLHGPHQGAHQSITSTPSFSTYWLKFSAVSATVAISCLRDEVYKVATVFASGALEAAVIDVKNLSKSYRVHRRAPGLGAALRSVIRRRYEEVKAVEDLSFHINEGERVGFLGPNG